MGKRNTHSLCAFAHKTTVDTVDGPNVCVFRREREIERESLYNVFRYSQLNVLHMQ